MKPAGLQLCLNFVSPGVGTYFERMRFPKIIDLQISMNSQSWQHDLDNTASIKCSIVNSTISSDYYYMQLSPSLQSQTISKDWNLETSKEKYDVKISKNPWICKTNPIGSSWLKKTNTLKSQPNTGTEAKTCSGFNRSMADRGMHAPRSVAVSTSPNGILPLVAV